MATTFELAILIDGVPHSFGELEGNTFVSKKDNSEVTTLKVANPKPVINEGVEFNLGWKNSVSFKAASPVKSPAAAKRTSAADAVKGVLAKREPTIIAKENFHSFAEGLNAQILAAAEAAKSNVARNERKA